MTDRAIKTVNAFPHEGPFSHASIVGPWIYTMGNGGIVPEAGRLGSPDVAEQTTQSMHNLERLLAACGASLLDVVQATAYLTDVDDHDRVNEAYLAAMGDHRPARSCFVAADLPVGEKMKIEMIAYRTRGT